MKKEDEYKKVDNNKHWYAIYTMPRTEKKVEQRLALKNIEVYLPLLETLRFWKDRKKKIKQPLITGFVFIFCKEVNIIEALDTDGVLNVIKFMKRPAKIPEYEINNLRILLKEPGFIDLNEPIDISKGEEVEVIRGPFVGLIGKCIRHQGKDRVVIELKVVEKIFEVNVELAFLQKKIQKVA